MSSINDTCKKWLDTRLTKEGSAFSENLKGLGGLAFKHLKQSPHYAMNTAKVGLGLGVGAALGETGLRTANNWAHGNPNLGAPTTTQHALSSFYDSLGTGAHINPAIAAVSNKVLDSVDVNPKAQEFLSAAANITNPAVRKALMGDAVNMAGQASSAIADNVGNTVGQAVGQGVSQGMAAGFWDNVKQHPIPTLTGAAAVSAGPLVAYDMLTKKRRQQEAERNKAILRYILRHENGMQKQSNLAEAIKHGAKGVANSPFFKKFIYRPTGIPADKAHIMDAYMAFKGHVPGKVADKLKDYPQTLLNNSVTRNPIKSLLGGGAAEGFAQTMAEAPTNQHAQDYSTAPGAYGHMIKNMTAVPMSVVEGVEGGLARSSALPRADKSQSIAKINEIVSNFTNPNKDYALAPNDPNYRPPHMELSPQQTDSLKNMDLGSAIGVQKSKPLGWMPYAALTGMFAAPAAAYGTYKHFANKKLNKAVDKADQMQNQVEHINKLVET